ncbi:chromate efflux transporter [Rhizorhapis sp. SPR117]|uniref:chromate efflux transporter n=1 Tax=Rhizorhapis sp. SPR117 TaxID=2912611 RepID=UPI001EFFCE9A|nr:chromate efflux transporter [Rhizorhapis sp. SPR117]
MHDGTARDVFGAFLKLGCISFGGPIAHLGYFRRELVERRRWLDDQAYGELVGLCQFLPGPASSQVGFALGLMRAGPLGGFAAWAGFTLPSALMMFGFALVATELSGAVAEAAIHGLKIAAVAVVAQALVGMARSLTPDPRRMAMAAGAAAAMLVIAVPAAQIALIVLGALIGIVVCPSGEARPQESLGWTPSRRAGIICLTLFAALLVLLPLAATEGSSLALADILYRAGALVFGGGHVVLPLLRAGLVPGWMNDGGFLAGYGAAQAVPGPLFALSAYLGAIGMPKAAPLGAVIALTMIFLPGLLLIAGMLPFRAVLGRSSRARAAIAGVNATVVGILAAALYDPLWTSGIDSLADALIALAGFALFVGLRVPPLAIVFGSVGAAVAVAMWQA